MMQIPWNGFYHDGAHAIFETLEAYLEWYRGRGGSIKSGSIAYEASEKVGIFFPRSLLVKKDLDLINHLIAGLEKRGIFPVPVFAQKKEYGGPDCPDPETHLGLLKGVDLIINCEASFLLQMPAGEETRPTILETLGVPVIQAVHSSAKTKEKWEKAKFCSPACYWKSLIGSRGEKTSRWKSELHEEEKVLCACGCGQQIFMLVPV